MYKRKTNQELLKELEEIDNKLIGLTPKLFNPIFEELLYRRRSIERLVG